MRRNLGVIGAVLLVAVLATGVSAQSPVRLFVNGRETATDVPPFIVNGRTLAPVRALAEALGAAVEWDAEERAVRLYDDREDLLRQLRQLERAVAPKTADDAAGTWAEGVKTRNAALQYAVLSHGLRERYKDSFRDLGWVTGTSSPWVEDYKVSRQDVLVAGNYFYSVEFVLMTSTGAGSGLRYVSVLDLGNQFCVTGIYDSVEQWEKQARLYEQVDELVGREFRHYRVLEKDISLQSLVIDGAQAEARYGVRVRSEMGVDKPEDWPTQEGKIKFLEENRSRLSGDALRKVEEHIAFWDKELRDFYIGIPSDSTEWLMVRAEFDDSELIREGTLQFYAEDPNGEYVPLDQNDLRFLSEEELVDWGYEEMRNLADSVGPSTP